MPVPVAPSLRPSARSAPAPAPPPKVPGVFEGWSWEALGGAAGLAIDEIPGRENLRRNSAFMEAIDALSDLTGEPMTAYIRGGWNMGSTGVDEDKFWRDLARVRQRKPDALKGWFADRAAFEATYSGAVAQGRAANEAAAATGGLAVQIVGGAAGAMGDPVNVLSLPLGGGKVVTEGVLALGERFLREGATNAGLEAFQQPFVAQERVAQGREALTLGEAAANVGLAGVGGGVLGATFEAAGRGGRAGVDAARGAFEQGVAANFEKLPRKLQERWAARATLPKPEQDMLDADVAEAVTPPDAMTGRETDALAVIRREAEIESNSPFVPNGAAAELHPALLGATLEALLSNAPPARLTMPTAGSQRAPTVPRIGAGSAYTGSRGIDLDTALGFIVDDLEGGARSNVDSGGLTRYGISKKGNPDVDVANLTRAQAMAIYRSRYAATLDLDNLPGDMGLVALDAAINHGPGFAQGLLRGANNVSEMLGRRRAEYARLIREDPAKYARYERGWENRLRRIEARLGRRPGEAGPIVREDLAGDERARIQAALDESMARADALAEAQRAARAQARGDPGADTAEGGSGAPALRQDAVTFEPLEPFDPIDLAPPAMRERTVDAGNWADVDKAFDAPVLNNRSLAERRAAQRERVFDDALMDGALDDVLGRAKADELTAAARAVEAGEIPREVFDRLADEDTLRAIARQDAALGDLEDLTYERGAARPSKSRIAPIEKRLAKRGFPEVPPSLTGQDFAAQQKWLVENRPTRTVQEEADPEMDFARAVNGAADAAPALAEMPVPERTAFLDPDGDALRTQVASLDHDARALALAGEGNAKLAAVVAELDADDAANAIIRECMA